MPSHDIHKLISRLITGSDGAEIHRILDAPHKLQGKLPTETLKNLFKQLRPPDSKYKRGHRQAFHTPQEAATLGYMIDGPRGARAALTHILADEHLTDQDKLLLAIIKNNRK